MLPQLSELQVFACGDGLAVDTADQYRLPSGGVSLHSRVCWHGLPAKEPGSQAHRAHLVSGIVALPSYSQNDFGWDKVSPVGEEGTHYAYIRSTVGSVVSSALLPLKWSCREES